MIPQLLDRLSITTKRLITSATKHPIKTVIYILCVVAAIIPMAILLVLLIRNSVNIPFWDQWIYVDLLGKWHDGSLGIYDLWKQHNEHRILIPKIFQILMSDITGWNIRLEVMANFAIGVASFTFMVLLLKRTFKNKLMPVFIAMPLVAWLFFSPVQYINWIWGFQLAWFISVLAVIVTVWALTKNPLKTIDRFFIVALAGAVIANYSMGNGMLIWGIGLAILLLRQASRRHYLLWIGTALPVVLSYFYHFHRPAHDSPFYLLTHRFGDLCDYFFTYLGRNLAFTQSSAKNTGIALLIILLICIYLVWVQRKIRAIIPWLAISAYGLLTAVLAAFSRMSDYGVEHAMVQSYTTISVLFVIGTLVTLAYTAALYLEKAPAGLVKKYLVVSFVLGAAAFPMAGGFWFNYTHGVSQLVGLGEHLGRVRHCVFNATSPDDTCLAIVYPDNTIAWEKIETLKKLNWDNLGQQAKSRP